jgi:hypothetical protein
MTPSFEKIGNEKYDLVGRAYLVLDVLCFVFFEAETVRLKKKKTPSDTPRNSASLSNKKKF